MNRIAHTILLTIFVCVILFNHFCTLNVAGGSSDHGNANVIGTVYDTLGSKIEGVSLRLLTADYNPVNPVYPSDSFSVVSNSKGVFSLSNIPSGIYSLIGEDASGQLRLYKNPIVIDSSRTNNLDVVLDRPGRVLLPIHQDVMPQAESLAYYLEGTDIFKEFESDLSFITFDNVPKGVYTLKGYDPFINKFFTFPEEYINFFIMSGGLVDFTIRPSIPRGPEVSSVDSICQFNTYFYNWSTYPHFIVEYTEYRFSWGDADTSAWSSNLYASHQWSQPGTYEIRVHMRCQGEEIHPTENRNIREKIPFYSGWSEPATILIY